MKLIDLTPGMCRQRSLPHQMEGLLAICAGAGVLLGMFDYPVSTQRMASNLHIEKTTCFTLLARAKCKFQELRVQGPSVNFKNCGFNVFHEQRGHMPGGGTIFTIPAVSPAFLMLPIYSKTFLNSSTVG